MRSQCRNITLPRVEGSEIRFLSPDEIGKLAHTIDPRYRPWSWSPRRRAG